MVSIGWSVVILVVMLAGLGLWEWRELHRATEMARVRVEVRQVLLRRER